MITLFLLPSALAATLLGATAGVVGRGEVGPAGGSALAEAAADRGDWATAASVWGDIPNPSTDTDLWHAIALLRLGEVAEAEATTVMAAARNPRDPRPLLVASWILLDQGNPKGAMKLSAGFPEHHPDSAGAVLLQMRAHGLCGELKKAARVRDHAAEDGIDDPWFWLESAAVDAATTPGGPMPSLRRAFRSPAVDANVYRSAIALLAHDNNLDDALEVGRQGTALFPDDFGLAVDVSKLLLDGGRAEDAARFDAEWSDRHPNPMLARRLMAPTILAHPSHEQAAQALRQWIADGAAPSGAYGLLAGIEVLGGDAEAGFLVLLDGTRRAPQASSLALDLIRTAEEMGSDDHVLEAAHTWERLTTPDREVIESAFAAARRLDRGPEALDWAQKAVALAPDDVWSHGLRADAWAELERSHEALDEYEWALARWPEDPWLLNNFAWFLLEPKGGLKPDPTRALDLAERSVAHSRAPVAARLDTLAAACWANSDHARALQLAREAVALDPQNAHLIERLNEYQAGP